MDNILLREEEKKEKKKNVDTHLCSGCVKAKLLEMPLHLTESE